MVVDTLNDEEGRLGALRRHAPSGDGPFEPLERIVAIARAAFGTSMVTISLLDRNAERVLAGYGLSSARPDSAGALGAVSIRSGKPSIVEDTLADPRCEGIASDGIRAYLGVPLQTSDRYNIGTLAIMDARPRRFTQDEVAIATDLARLAVHSLASGQPKLDYLTNALTRSGFQAAVEREFIRSARYERPAALVFLDIDGFRDVNAAIGAETAEEVLKTVANCAAQSLRSTDSFGRIGGEEFGILLPETLAYEASQCSERLREEISRLRFRHAGGVLSVTVSFGIAPFSLALSSAVQWFAQADIALYGSKQAGGNCVSFAPPVERGHPAVSKESAEPTVNPMH